MESGKSDLNITSAQCKSSTSVKMAVSKEELMELSPDDVFEFEVKKLDNKLKELNINKNLSSFNDKNYENMMKTLTTYLCTILLLEKSKKLGENKNLSSFSD